MRNLEHSKQCLFNAGTTVARPICPNTSVASISRIELREVRSRTGGAGGAYYVFLTVYLIKRFAQWRKLAWIGGLEGERKGTREDFV